MSVLTPEQLQRLRVAIAEKMGLHPYIGVLALGSHCQTCGEYFSKGSHYYGEPPDLTNDFAHEIIGGLKEEGWSVNMFNQPDDKWICKFQKWNEPKTVQSSMAPTFAIAVALAAAKTWGIEV